MTDPWMEDELVLRLGVWPKIVYDEQMRRSVKEKKSPPPITIVLSLNMNGFHLSADPH